MTNQEVLVLQTIPVDHACVLTNLQGVEKLYQFNDGVARAAHFPQAATISMDPDWPDNTLLIDAYETKYGLTFVSPRFYDFLHALALDFVELLPVTLLNHRNRPADTYYIFHPTNPVECLDYVASGVEFDSMDPDSIESIQQLALDAARIPVDREVFRIKGLRGAIFFKRLLAEKMLSHQMAGFTFVQCSEFIYV